MADDLDAFFEEVSAAEAEVIVEEKDDSELEEPPAKKAKTTTDKPVRPVGVVVAAAASSTKAPPVTNTTTVETVGVSSLPPLPPATTAAASVVSAVATTLPPLPVTANPPLPPGPPPNQKSNKAHVRTAAGKRWVDPSLNEWPENDYRIFVGNLSLDVTDQQLHAHFQEYPSIAKAKVVRDKEGNSKGYGFVSLLKPLECAKAIREKDQSWLSSRPIRTKRSDWNERELKVAKKRQRKKGYLR